MTAEECIHGLTPETCSICKHGVSRRGPEKPTVMYHLTASVRGSCRGCDLPIYVGEGLVRLTDDSYVHDGCQP